MARHYAQPWRLQRRKCHSCGAGPEPGRNLLLVRLRDEARRYWLVCAHGCGNSYVDLRPALTAAETHEAADAVRSVEWFAMTYPDLVVTRGRGRPRVRAASDYNRRRADAVAAIVAVGQRPTRLAIAERLGISVRSVFNYDHGLA